jgi:type VI secretion system secreted protein VgrG
MFTQENRHMQITTPLGADAMILVAVRGREAVSELFHFEFDVMWLKDEPLRFTDLLGKTVIAKISEEDARYINGIVKSIDQGARDRERGFTKYTFHVVPNTWFLTRKAQSRIFQDKSVPEIIKAVLSGMTATLKTHFTATYAPRDYCVQYRETDFEFISRLMEDEGIFYFYQHDASQHTLWLADHNSAYLDLPEIVYEEVVGGYREEGRINEWTKSQEIRSGHFTLRDYNFETPGYNLETDARFPQTVSVNQSLEVYDYPGGYMKTGDGSTIVKNRLNEENSPGVVVRGSSWNRSLCPAGKFALRNHYSDDGKYVVMSVQHSSKQPLDIGPGTEEDFEYENIFTAIPADVIYRPPLVTPPPRVDGVQTALVVGPSGEEIYTDKYGRIKVQFHWDREGKKNENSSCWMRVATFWAGKNWGGIHIPRIGQEVVIDFVDGDVDRPLVVGSVYNAAMMPPYALPGEKTKSGIQSRSSKGGGAANYNEIRFEDKKGSEQVLIHAEKNQDIEVENDETHWVGHDRTKTIDHDETEHVKHDRTKSIDNDESVKIGHDHTISIAHSDTESVGKDQAVTVGHNRSKSIANNEEVQVGNNQTFAIGNKLQATIGMEEDREAGTKIKLTVGPSSITIDPTGITIKGMTINIEGQIQVNVKGLMTNINGTAMTVVKGGIVMIN